MTAGTAVAAFVAAAGLLTVTPGLDTALVLRSRWAGGAAAGFIAAIGVGLGCLAWGSAVALGLGAVLTAAPRAYDVLRWCGALYLLWCGLMMLFRPRTGIALDEQSGGSPGLAGYLLRGLLTNLLNPKVGLFYISFLPQFVPSGVSGAPFMLLLAMIHIVMGLLWSGALVVGTGAIRRYVVREGVLPWLDRLTGGVFVGFALKLALDRR